MYTLETLSKKVQETIFAHIRSSLRHAPTFTNALICRTTTSAAFFGWKLLSAKQFVAMQGKRQPIKEPWSNIFSCIGYDLAYWWSCVAWIASHSRCSIVKLSSISTFVLVAWKELGIPETCSRYHMSSILGFCRQICIINGLAWSLGSVARERAAGFGWAMQRDEVVLILKASKWIMNGGWTVFNSCEKQGESEDGAEVHAVWPEAEAWRMIDHIWILHPFYIYHTINKLSF